ncbi:hypothetical protein A3Q56_00797 [Intoshia linei]|uniref:Regulator of telomere elongation helicase 1 homolog n=1 Tax=Intoshia linei TaxID=1819745 RepID=A0A177BD31_9BILA|nr:hypothetical protein A3Q56_00797 [Intoshia linei]
MPTFVKTRNVNVNFPFEPYPSQIDYMSKVLECLQDGSNGLLESPTGTGKTLCLLCSSLAWLENKKAQVQNKKFVEINKEALNMPNLDDYRHHLTQNLDKACGNYHCENNPKIIYATRTHSQISQVMSELKKTAYSHFKTTILASRSRYCIHPVVSKETHDAARNSLCSLKVKTRKCIYYNRVENNLGNFDKIYTLDEMVTKSTKLGVCPYFTSREMQRNADIIFVPYNYLLSQDMRKVHDIDVKDCIIIFDEAHNLEGFCEDNLSVEFTSIDVALSIRDIVDITPIFLSEQEFVKDKLETKGDKKTNEPLKISHLIKVKQILEIIEKELEAIQLSGDPPSMTYPGNYIYTFLDKAGIHQGNKRSILHNMEVIIDYITDKFDGGIKTKGNGLNKMYKVFKSILRKSTKDNDNILNYKIYIEEVDPKQKYQNSNFTNKYKSLNFWCFNSAESMQDLMSCGTVSIILTSGTLSPFNSFKYMMGIDFKVTLQNSHVIDNDQMLIRVVPQGPDQTFLNPSYKTRFSQKYQDSLGNTIINFCRHCRDGFLIFFQSYSFLNLIISSWKTSGIYARLEKLKNIYVEPRNKGELSVFMQDFYSSIDQNVKTGSIFIAVCGGKVSEGIDFSDKYGRCVVLIGIPFPPKNDPRISLKIKHLNSKKDVDLTGQEWYTQQAYRSANQAIGRIIRHRHDFGVILLVDQRYTSKFSQDQLPKWIQKNVRVYNSFSSSIGELIRFFKTRNSKCFPKSELKELTQIENDVPSTSTMNTSLKINIKNLKRNKSIDEKYQIPQKVPLKLNNSMNYLGEIRKFLSNDEYECFSTILKLYKQDQNILKVIQELTTLFLTKKERNFLYRDFSQFVRKSQQKTFNDSWDKFVCNI